MSFSSNEPSITNQLPLTVNLPDIARGELFQDRLQDIIKEMTLVVNSKEGGLYSLQEKFSSQTYFTIGDPQTFRNVYRKVLDFVNLNSGNIGASATVSFVHGITGVDESAMIYANCTATDGRRFSVVFASVWITGTTAFFTNPIAVALTQCDVVINCLKA